jgi:hypothetical protein
MFDGVVMNVVDVPLLKGDFTRTGRITLPSKWIAIGSPRIGARSCVTTVKKHVPPGTYQRRYSDM